MNSNMTYSTLYSNMVKKFTVEKNGVDYKLGDYMLMKAKSKTASETKTAKKPSYSNLPALIYRKETGASAVGSIISYVSEKLTVKEAPIKNKTMRAFPLRTSITAFCSAMVVCALIVSCGIFGINAGGSLESAANNEVKQSEAENEVITDNTITYYHK